MKPKVSTGYLTPQAKKTKTAAKTKIAAISDTEETEGEINEDLFQALLKCPEKKKLVLQLLASNKNAIDKYRNQVDRAASPVNKLKIKKKAACESPTALLRRRALEQMNSSPSTSNRSETSSRPNSRLSEASSYHSSPVPVEKVLDGVIAYVEIKSRLDEDRSGGAKAVLKSLGAKVREKFTNDVTHVIFKDGSYTTFQRAKLMKIHLVSILWVEFCRKTMQRQNEKQYPAMKSGFDDETMICSQMQKEYEDIIREEYRISIVHGTPLPTTRSLIDRRRTLMTPSFTNHNTSSSSSFRTAIENNSSSQEISDKEVADINGFQYSENIGVDAVAINDPDCFSAVTGPVVNGSIIDMQPSNVLKSLENLHGSDMDLTNISPSLHTKKTPICSDMELTKIPGCHTPLKPKPTTSMPSKNLSKTAFSRRKTICNSLLSSDLSTTNGLLSSDKSIEASNLSSDKSTNISDSHFAVPKASSKRLTKGLSSSLLGSNESFVFGKNTAKMSKKVVINSEVEITASAMSELKLVSDNELSKSTGNSRTSVRRSTSMSSLQISSEPKINESSRSSSTSATSAVTKLTLPLKKMSLAAAESSIENSSMSALHVSSEKSGSISQAKKIDGPSKKTSFSKSSSGKLIESDNLKKPSKQKPEDSDGLSKSSMSGLHISSEEPKTSAKSFQDHSKSSMSPLNISSEKSELPGKLTRPSRKKSISTSIPDNSRSSMTTLHISSEKHKEDQVSSRQTLKKSNNADGSFESFISSGENTPNTIKPVVQDIIRTLQTPDFVTVRRKGASSRSVKSNASDDSEIISPKKMNNVTSTISNEKLKEDLPKDLVVNIIKSPLCDKLDIPAEHRRPRRRTLGVKVSKKLGMPISNRGRRKTTGPKEVQSAQAVENTRKDLEKTESTSSESSTISNRRKARKLYNLDDSIPVIFDDEKERQEKRNQIKKRKSDESVFINPIDMLKSTKKPVESSSESETKEATPPKRTRKATGNQKNISLNASADEQKTLLDEVLNKKNKVVPKTPTETPSRRKSTRVSKPSQKVLEMVDSSKKIKPVAKSQSLKKASQKKEVLCTPVNRRSTLEFMSLSQFKSSTKSKKKKIDKTKLPTIVCTKLHKEDVQVFCQIVKKLGRFVVEDEVSDRTTHVIAGEPKRTVNMLRAISRGCWILNLAWVLQSLEEGKWLPEGAFEVTDFSPSVQKCRLERQAFGPKYTMDIFETCPPIYVAPSSMPRCSDLRELIATCKGTVVNVPRMAKLVVGEYVKQEGTTCVHESWVLDSITFYRKMPFKDKYLICSKRKSMAV